LQLTNRFVYHNLEHNVHSFLLVKTVVELDRLVTRFTDDFFSDFNCFNQIVDVFVNYFASDQISDVKGSWNLLALSFFKDTCDFFGPDFYDVMDDVSHGHCAVHSLELSVDFLDNIFFSFLNLFFEKFFHYSQDDLELVLLVFGHFHVLAIEFSASFLTNICD